MTGTIKSALLGAAAAATLATAAPAPIEPFLPRDEAALPGDFTRGADIPPDLDPLAEGVLMLHQREWLEDKSDLKICKKGRRTGITFAEALDDTLIAAAARSAGGDNVFYIGDTKDKGREFIGYVAHFAKVVAKEAFKSSAIEEFLFEDKREDGTSKFISAYRVTFASGFRVEALSSRPENIRGLQGVVVIDEAAFHNDVSQVIDAVNALLIWGGKIRIISSPNGLLNPFNDHFQEALAGKNGYSAHFYTFNDAIRNGLYKRVCLMKGWTWSAEAEAAWEAKIRQSYGTRTAAMHQELDAIDADAQGAALSRVVIEQRARRGVPVVRYHLPDSFKGAKPAIRKATVAEFLRTQVRPHLDKLDPNRRHDTGMDFARSGDGSVLIVRELGQDLVRRDVLVLELRNVPYESQRDIVFYVLDALPRFGHGAFDANGNGGYLGEVAQQRYGDARISAIKPSQEWYRENGTPYIGAFGDETIEIAADEDIIRDHQALQYVNGVIMVPQDMRYKGSDGLVRHGDAGIAGMLAWFASRQGAVEYGYEPVKKHEPDPWQGDDDDLEDEADGHAFRGPLGARLRGGGI